MLSKLELLCKPGNPGAVEPFISVDRGKVTILGVVFLMRSGEVLRYPKSILSNGYRFYRNPSVLTPLPFCFPQPFRILSITYRVLA